MQVTRSLSKRPLDRPRVRGFSMGMKLLHYDGWHSVYAQKLLHELCRERGIEVTSAEGTPEITLGEVTVRSHGQRILRILECVLTPYYLESNDFTHEELHCRVYTFPVLEISAWETRDFRTGRKKNTPKLLHSVPFEKPEKD